MSDRVEDTTICDCHTWPTVQEMHQYVIALEARIRVVENKQQNIYLLTDERLAEMKWELGHDLWPSVSEMCAMVDEIQARRTT